MHVQMGKNIILTKNVIYRMMRNILMLIVAPPCWEHRYYVSFLSNVFLLDCCSHQTYSCPSRSSPDCTKTEGSITKHKMQTWLLYSSLHSQTGTVYRPSSSPVMHHHRHQPIPSRSHFFHQPC